MKTLLVYDSAFGNTEKVALEIARLVRQHSLLLLSRIEEANLLDLEGVDLLVVGSPTQRHQPTLSIQAWLAQIPDGALRHLQASAFDTRYNMPTVISGSAASAIRKQLRKKGARRVLPSGSFVVSDREGPLVEGEIERVAEWVRQILAEAGVNLGAEL